MADEPSTEAEEYVCDICGKKFKTIQALANHKKFKHGYRPGKSAIEHDRKMETGVAKDSDSDIAEILTLDEDSITSAKRIKTSIDLEPEILLLYTYTLEKGFKGSIGDFINACVINYMKDKAGVVVALVSKQEEEDEVWLS